VESTIRIEATDLTPLEQRLVDEAIKIRPRAYAVYSNYLVGAAVADADGGVHVGANMEGAEYTLTVHAEQHAMNAMRLATNAKAVALAFAVQSPSPSPSPCGVCRQRIREFAGSLQMPIIAVSLDERLKIERLNRYPFDELLPYSFGPENLGK
jgi:cytidine deaminase